MEKVHSDEIEKPIIDIAQLKPSEELTFKIGEVTLVAPDRITAVVNEHLVGTEIKIVCIAPGKFEVWA